MKVTVSPRYTKASYYAFYLHGLDAVFQNRVTYYSTKGMLPFNWHGLALVVEGSSTKRIFISASDGCGINPAILEWCDVYAKVNAERETAPKGKKEKILPIGPSFGIRAWSLFQTLWHAFATVRYVKKEVSALREHFGHFRGQLRRAPLSAYEPRESSRDYVFHASSLWKSEECTNESRARFIEIIGDTRGLSFEGGFAPREDVPGYDRFFLRRRYNHEEYLARTKRSLLVFNTPAVSQCHGWKLGEYLALGKAIVSTPLVRAMPAELRHGVDVHFVDGSYESIRDAVRRIAEDDGYRGELENNARAYFLRYLEPRRVVERVVDAAYGEEEKS
jgi:hypothetical protein